MWYFHNFSNISPIILERSSRSRPTKLRTKLLSNIFGIFTPTHLGKWSHLTSIFFQTGWFNHQLDLVGWFPNTPAFLGGTETDERLLPGQAFTFETQALRLWVTEVWYWCSQKRDWWKLDSCRWQIWVAYTLENSHFEHNKWRFGSDDFPFQVGDF